MEFHYRLFPLGDSAVVIQLGKDITNEIHRAVQTVTAYLDNHPYEWMIEYIPAYTTVSIFYDPMKIPLSSEILPYDYVCSQLQQWLIRLKPIHSNRQNRIEIPVCYGGTLGPDLAFVAEHNALTPQQVIEIHTNGNYLVHMIGFAPGFPYIGGMSEKIAAPRKASPRLKIPARSVGIAGKQTGVYPIETPGGWQIIGRTPFSLFRPNNQIPSLLKAGDRIMFKQINLEEYLELEEINR